MVTRGHGSMRRLPKLSNLAKGQDARPGVGGTGRHHQDAGSRATWTSQKSKTRGPDPEANILQNEPMSRADKYGRARLEDHYCRAEDKCSTPGRQSRMKQKGGTNLEPGRGRLAKAQVEGSIETLRAHQKSTSFANIYELWYGKRRDKEIGRVMSKIVVFVKRSTVSGALIRADVVGILLAGSSIHGLEDASLTSGQASALTAVFWDSASMNSSRPISMYMFLHRLDASSDILDEDAGAGSCPDEVDSSSLCWGSDAEPVLCSPPIRIDDTEEAFPPISWAVDTNMTS
ncbi:hypothetical protein CERSUDRAFT_124015 [Gelatoporia subvermispora B]|uniref:Uncharacterized protein n=1 Tax=Ceriporiopsis subvermispora (strain B) TaxID=914234 RepID=M2QJ19_CERS8|nr:hypothetical protein CERSUDRAFT_124015 [Gelatoporia subvermispora B]